MMRDRLLIAFVLFCAPGLLVARTGVDIDEEDVYFLLSGEADKAIADGDYDTAVMRINEAISYDPANPSNVLLLSNLGILYSCLDRDTLALDALNKAHAIAPAMNVVLENRGKLLLKMGDNVGAYTDFTTVIDRDSCNVNARYYHGMMTLYGGDYRAAEADFEVLESCAPNAYNTYVAMSSLYSMTGRELQAVPYYKKLIEQDAAPEFYSALAGCYLALEDLSEASAIIDQGLNEYPYDPELYYYRAWLNRDRYLLKEAHADADRAVILGLDPRKARALFGDRATPLDGHK